MNRWFSINRLLTLPVPRLFSLGPLVIIAVTGCASNGGAIPAPPAIERPEIVSSDGSFILNWDVSPESQNPRSYQYERYKNGSLENSTVVAVNSFKHYYLTEGSYEFRVRGCGSDEACGAWASVTVSCEDETGGVFCWQQLVDNSSFKLVGRDELDGAGVEVWDSYLVTTKSGCQLPIRAIRKAGVDTYKPLVFIHGGGWHSPVLQLSRNGGSIGIYNYKNIHGIAPETLAIDNPEPRFRADGTYDLSSTFASFDSGRSLLVALLNEDFMIFDVEYVDINASEKKDNKCQGRWEDVISTASALVKKLYDPSTAAANLPTDKLANSLPALLGVSAGGHLVHYISSHEPEKILRAVNVSGLLSWDQYKKWKDAGLVQYNIWFEVPVLGTVASPAVRGELSQGDLVENMPDIVGLPGYGIPQTLDRNSFELSYGQQAIATPPIYHVNFAQDIFYAGKSDDYVISAAQGNFFCAYVSGANNLEPVILTTTKTGYNSRHLLDCGAGNYLDQFYDDPDEPEDHLALVKAHAAITEAQLKAILDFLRYGEVTAAAY